MGGLLRFPSSALFIYFAHLFIEEAALSREGILGLLGAQSSSFAFTVYSRVILGRITPLEPFSLSAQWEKMLGLLNS